MRTRSSPGVIDLDCTAKPAHSRSNLRSEVAREFMSPLCTAPRFLIGRNEEAGACAAAFRIDGLIDDFASANSTWNDLPVIGSAALPPGAIVANCSSSVAPVSAHARVEGQDGVRVIAYADLVCENGNLPLPRFVASTREDVNLNRIKWLDLEGRLDDDSSRKILEKLLSYRLTGDYAHMSGFSVRFDEQYFDPVVETGTSEVFVDCGGYDGDTVLEFCRRTPRYSRVYMFEPSPVNLAQAERRLRGLRDIVIVPNAVSDTPGRLAFDPDGGSASRVAHSGSLEVDVVTIDDTIAERVTFIKMDLEGWEKHALVGAKGHVLRDHPKLAVAVYHRPDDFWRIPEYVLGLRSDYDLHLRHYSEGWSETVMYFIPR